MAIFPGGTATDTDLQVAKDRSESTLSGSISNSTLSVGVVDGTKFVANQVITIEDEQMQIASIASNTLTIATGTRGFNGTTAASHASSTLVYGNAIADHHNKVKDEIIAIETFLSAGVGAQINAGTYSALPSPGTAGNIYIADDAPYWFRDNGASWDAYLPGWGKVTVPPSSSWTWESQGGSTVDFTNGLLYLHFTQIGSFLRAYYRAAPSTPYKIRVIFRHSLDGGLAGVTGGNDGFGLGFRDSSGKWIIYRLGMNGVNAFVINGAKWNSISSFSADYFTTSNVPDSVLTNGGVEIQDDGTNLILSLSVDGFHWEVIHTISRTNFFASGPDSVGIIGYMNSSDVHLGVMSWQVV